MYSFKYRLDPLSLQIANCATPPTQICYDCLYDLEIIITGECNNQGLNGNVGQDGTIIRAGDPIIYKYQNFTIDPPNSTYTSTCSPASLEKSFAVNFFSTGQYTITKTLTVNKKMQESFMDDYLLMQNNSCRSFSQVLAEYQIQMASQNAACFKDCNACKAAIIGGEIGYVERFKNTYSLTNDQVDPYREQLHFAFLDAVENCNEMCYEENNTSSRASNYRRALLDDMMPSQGQYARLVRPDDATTFGGKFQFLPYPQLMII